MDVFARAILSPDASEFSKIETRNVGDITEDYTCQN